MDTVTHTLFALTLGRTRLGEAGRGTTAALVIASNIPDIDIVATLRDGAAYLQWHRGPTHGVLAIVALGVPAAAAAWLVTRIPRTDAVCSRGGAGLSAVAAPEPKARRRAPFMTLAAVSMIGVLFHLSMDFPTSYGTRLLSPFDWRWFAVDWMPIIDIYLIIVLIVSLVAGRKTPAARRRAVNIAFAFMLGNYALRGFFHHQAVKMAPRVYGPLPAKCTADEPAFGPERWPQDGVDLEPGTPRPCLLSVAAMPTFLLPTAWRVITQLSNGYEIHDLDLLNVGFRRASDAPQVRLHFPNEWTQPTWVASATRLGRIYLGFSRYPAARSSIDDAGTTTVRWIDMRFAGGALRLERPPRREPFSAVVRFDRTGRVIEERFGP